MNYEGSFFQLYSGSGIWSEYAIKDMYVKSADDLRQSIISGINQRLSENKVLGRREGKSMVEISFHVGDRLIIVFFSEDKLRSLRIVESIFIGRKPIIF